MKTIDISGFGENSYEAGCQLMLLRGIKWLNEHPDFNFNDYKVFANVMGSCFSETDAANELSEVITKGIDATGAMHHAVISHLAYIHKHGYDGWLTEGKKNGMKVYERPSEEDLDKTILVSQIEWQLKLDGGYDPMAELFKVIPIEDIIEVDPKDPDSIKKAAEEIARRMKK